MPRIPDMLLDCVVYLYPDADSARQGKKTGGAGFLLDFYMPQPINKTAYYVVTCKHVAIRDCNTVRLNTHSGEVVIVELDRFHWTHHDDGDNLSICPIFGLHDDWHKFRSLSVEMLISKEKIASLDIGIGDEVFTVGRVTGAEGRLRNLPTARFGNIAQMPVEPFLQENGHWQESFVVEARSISGFSGSPVFLQIFAGTPRFSKTRIPPTEQGALLLGVNWGHLHDQERVRTAVLSVAVSLIALAVAIVAIRKSDRNTSAATLVTLNEGFRQGWHRFLPAEEEVERQHEFSELMNLLEIGCAIYMEGSLSGVSRELAEEYLGNVLSLLEANQEARTRIEAMRQSPTTFKYIRQFLVRMGRLGHPHKIAAVFSTT